MLYYYFLFQPIMAIFRCEPNDKNRPLFNIFHFIVGLLAHLSAGKSVILLLCALRDCRFLFFHKLADHNLGLLKVDGRLTSLQFKHYCIR